MLLHNQRNAPLTWEAAGNTYRWEPYGSCDVPDKFLADLREQGFPVDVTPKPPEARSRDAAAAERAASEASELRKLRARVKELEEISGSAASATEGAEMREAAALERVADLEAQNAVLEGQRQSLAKDSAQFEKLLTEAMTKIEQLESAAAEQKAARKQRK